MYLSRPRLRDALIEEELWDRCRSDGDDGDNDYHGSTNKGRHTCAQDEPLTLVDCDQKSQPVLSLSLTLVVFLVCFLATEVLGESRRGKRRVDVIGLSSICRKADCTRTLAYRCVD